MGAGGYLIAAGLVGITCAALVATAAAIRSLALPSWTGAPARLVEAVLAIGVLVVSAQGLAVAGLLDRGPLVVVLVAVTAAAQGAARRRRPGPATAADPPASMNHVGLPRWATMVAVAAVVVIAAQWGARVAESYDGGITDADSLGYHLPFAAGFARGGSPLSFHFTIPDMAQTFHPANGELVHAVGMVLTGRDILSPLVNLGWLALALLAGWCIGRPWGAAPISLLGVAVMFGAPVMAISQAGTGGNDAAVTALLLAAAGILASSRFEASPALAVAGLAAGLAVGTKLTAAAPVAILTLAAVVAAWRARRLLTAMTWAVPLALGGGIWFLRNLIRSGSPVPALDLGPLPSPPIALVDEYGYAVSDYLLRPGLWRRLFLPGLLESFSAAWPVLVLGAALAAVVVLTRGRRPVDRWLAVAALATMAAYVVTPTTAFGAKGEPSGIFFSGNLRYVVPGIALALALVPAVRLPAAAGRWAVVVLATAITVQQLDRGAFPAWPDDHRLAGVVIGVAVAAALVAAWRVGALPAAVAGAALVVAIGWPVSGGYFEHRYVDVARPAGPAYRWARDVSGERIALAGFFQQYPLFGTAAANHVQFVGHRGPHGEFTHARDCREWRASLAGGRYRFVVTAPTFSHDEGEPPEAEWTRTDPAAVEVVRDGAATVFRLDRPPDPRACGPGQARNDDDGLAASSR